MKAQSAIEFITAYSWAIILLLLAIFMAFYYISAQQPTPKCDFGTDLPCTSFKLFQNSTSDIRLVFQLNNGMGKVITLNGAQITVNNIGKSGVNNYAGTCWGNTGMIKGGDPIYCTFDIRDTAVIPPANKVQPVDITLNYVDCETASGYPTSCLGGLNRTVHGTVTASFEVVPNGMASCGDGLCGTGETYLNCPIDCPPTCGTDCTFGHTGICSISCGATCSAYYTFNPACDNVQMGSNACSNSTGGTLNLINFQASCCGGTITNCGNTQYCNSATGNCTACSLNWGNCDQNSANGCEDNLQTDNNNCNGCGNVCAPGTSCVNGQCVCSATFPLVYRACYNFLPSSVKCSNSTGGTSGTLTYTATCCNVTITSCGTTNCPSNYCTAGSPSYAYTYPSSCNNGCSGGICSSCTCTASSTSCGTTNCPSNYCTAGSPSYAYTYPSTCYNQCSGVNCASSCTCATTPTNCGTSSCPSSYCNGNKLCTYPSTCYNQCSGVNCASSCTCTASCSASCSCVTCTPPSCPSNGCSGSSYCTYTSCTPPCSNGVCGSCSCTSHCSPSCSCVTCSPITNPCNPYCGPGSKYCRSAPASCTPSCSGGSCGTCTPACHYTCGGACPT